MHNLDENYLIAKAIKEIYKTYGHVVSVDEKSKHLKKYGANYNLGTSFETIWQVGGHETYATGNDIDSVSSSDDNDVQLIYIEGHTRVGDKLYFKTQTVTLTGNTPAPLTTKLYRVGRIININTDDFAGDIYIYESGGTVTLGVPQVTSDIHLKVPVSSASNKSLKAATSTSFQDYWLITSFDVSVGAQQSRSVDFELQIRPMDGVFTTEHPLSCHSNSGTVPASLTGAIVIPPNHDIRVIGKSSGATTAAIAVMGGPLALITNNNP